MSARFGISDRPTREILIVAVSFLLLNAPFWWMQRDYFLVRPWCNIELVVPLVLFPRFGRLGLLALCVCWTLDLAVSSSAVFHFDSAYEFVRSAQFISEMRLSGFVSWSRAWMALPFLVAAIATWKLLRDTISGEFPLVSGLLCATLVVAVDIANGSSIISRRAVHLFEGNPAGSPTFTLAIRGLQGRNQIALSPLPEDTSAAQVADIAGWAKTHPDGSAVLMVVESMGWHTNPAMRHWLLARLSSPAVKLQYEISERPIRFTEATTSAELRELCGLRGSYRKLTATVGAGCLPSRLSALGWETNGYHGFSGKMFDRQSWWSLTGIKQGWFADDLFRPGDRRCGGGFPGLCDSEVVERALANAKRPRTLSYILTLNSHLPLTPLPIPPDLGESCQLSGATDQVCVITATIGEALAAMRPALEAPRRNPMLVVIVGDHAPPFSDLASRGQYRDNVVPAFVLRPRESAAGS